MIKCNDCDVEVVHAQVSMQFNAVDSASQDWEEFAVLAEICPKCGKIGMHAATPQQLTAWLHAQKGATKAASRG